MKAVVKSGRTLLPWRFIRPSGSNASPVVVLQHLPDSWSRQPDLLRLAPEGWKRDHQLQPSIHVGPPEEPKPELSVSAKQSRTA